jgi:hypothetical protein
VSVQAVNATFKEKCHRSGKKSGEGRSLAPLATLWILSLVVPTLAQSQEASSSVPDVASATTAANLPDSPSSATPAAMPYAVAAAIPVATIDHSLTFGQRVHIWEHSVFNPETIFGPAISAGVNQARNQPSGFFQGAEGYADRFGSAVGRNVIGKTISFGFAAVDREDPRYFREEGRSVWARTGHAIASTFVSPTASGRRIPAFSHFAGAYGAAFIANAWYPDNQTDAEHALKRGSISLGVGMGLNLLREFMPHFNNVAPR